MRESLKDNLAKSGFRFDKRYGQNFISDTNLLKAIVEDAKIGAEDSVLEIGAGGGALTTQLAQVAKKVLSYEIDTTLSPILDITAKLYDNVEIVFADFMKVVPEDIFNALGKGFKVVANLPYYITTPIIMKLLTNQMGKSITIMVQEEVAQRITATEGSKEYGAITAQIRLQAETKLLRKVSRHMFFPSPNVDSAVISIIPTKKYAGQDIVLTQRIIKAAFAMRRKTLINNLINELKITREFAQKAIQNVGLSANIRGEMLSVNNFVELSDYLNKEEKI